MPRKSSISAEVRFIDRDEVIRVLREAVARAKARFPEIVHVFLFGSFVRNTWTADSDADLMVVVRKELKDFFAGAPYQIYAKSISTDSLVYSDQEFETMKQDPQSFVAQNLKDAVEL